jgi:uncharacterized protein (DUF58 family)
MSPSPVGSATSLGRFQLLAGLTYLLVFLGLLTLNGMILALAVPLVVYLAFTLANRPPKLEFSAERKVSVDSVPPNTPVVVTLRITNHGSDLDEVMVEDHLPRGMTLVEGKMQILTSLPHDATVEMVYTVKAPRGSYYLQDVMVSASDHLGTLVERVSLPARQRLIFLPEILRLRRVVIRPPRTHGHFGPIPSRQSGSGVDFIGLREYQMGDPLRWINWRANARHEQDLFVNQFEKERIANVGLILDARQQSNIVLSSGESLFEYSVQAAGALSEALLNEGNRVGLLIYGFGMERTFPGYGKVQQERILYSLGQARTGHKFALESLGFLPTRFFPTGSQIVMVSPLLPSDVAAFMQLRACGYEVLVVSPDPVDFEARAIGVKDDLAGRVARTERALLLRRLEHLGVRVLDWSVSQPFEPLVRARLGRVPAARRF